MRMSYKLMKIKAMHNEDESDVLMRMKVMNLWKWKWWINEDENDELMKIKVMK